MLVLKYHLTEEEYLDYNYFTAWTSPDKKSYRLKYYLQVMILYIAVAGLYITANRSHTLLLDSGVFVTIGTIYFLLVPVLVKRSIRMRVKRVLAKPENQHVLNESEVTISETGILDRDTVSESRYDWEAIVRKAETKRCYYLYTNSYHAIVIPKRVLKVSEQEMLYNFFNTHLSLSSDFA
ncbi:MAG: YcxB family protein [Chitinophagaceae bacterium]|nr:MAG: YcxB family protein [Chitinophagaceae bacterium]